jgi:acetoin utilization deacetylase AcuC-like enzyme
MLTHHTHTARPVTPRLQTASLLARGLAERVLIVDLDVHQGDGTATMLAHEPRAFTLSVHCATNFPARKAASTLDVALPAGTGDDAFLDALAGVLPDILASFRPSIVLYDAGVDPHASDGLGRLALSDDGLWRREMMVLNMALAAGVPVAGYVGGGYDTDLEVLAARHCLLHKAAAAAWVAHKL